MSYHLNLTQANTDFANTHYQRQIQALKAFLPIIDMAVNSGVSRESIAFGGGTALAMYYLGHRLSFDIDLFVSDAQFLDYFKPYHWLDDFESFKDEFIVMTHHISIETTNNIKIDLLCSQNVDENLTDNSKAIFDEVLYINSIEDIIAKKINFRGEYNKARDIFDIVVSLEKYPDILNNLLDKKAIDKESLTVTKEALGKINMEQYKDAIAIVKPFELFRDLALNAPDIFMEKISKILEQKNIRRL